MLTFIELYTVKLIDVIYKLKHDPQERFEPQSQSFCHYKQLLPGTESELTNAS